MVVVANVTGGWYRCSLRGWVAARSWWLRLGGGYGAAYELCSCMIWRMFCTPVCRCLTMAVAVAVASRRISASTMATCSCSVTW